MRQKQRLRHKVNQISKHWWMRRRIFPMRLKRYRQVKIGSFPLWVTYWPCLIIPPTKPRCGRKP